MQRTEEIMTTEANIIKLGELTALLRICGM